MPGYLRPHIKKTVPSDHEKADLISKNDGDSGDFWVELTFCPQFILHRSPGEEAPHSALGGDSHFQIHEALPPGEAKRRVATVSYSGEQQLLRYFVFCNAAGRMSHINVRCQAVDSDAAEKTAKKGIEPLFAHLCVTFNAPVNVLRIRVMENSTGVTSSTLFHQTYPIVDVSAEAFSAWVGNDYRAIHFYREALSTTSPKYQLLCYYKVIELLLELQAKRASQERQAGNSVNMIVERFSDEQWLADHISPELLGQIVGKKYTWIKDKVLRPVRDKVAHALLKETDSFEHHDEEVFPYLPIAKVMAEKLIAQNRVTLRRDQRHGVTSGQRVDSSTKNR